MINKSAGVRNVFSSAHIRGRGSIAELKYISDSSTFVYHAVALLLVITELDNNVSATPSFMKLIHFLPSGSKSILYTLYFVEGNAQTLLNLVRLYIGT